MVHVTHSFFLSCSDISQEKSSALIDLIQNARKQNHEKKNSSTVENVLVKLPQLNMLCRHNNILDKEVLELRRLDNTPNSVKHSKQNFIYLHAYSLSFPHPISKEVVSFHAPVPEVWAKEYDMSIVNEINKSIKALCGDVDSV